MSSSQAAKKTSLGSVLNEVTKEKLTCLEKQRQTLESHFAPILKKFEKPQNKTSLAFLKEIHETLVSARDDNPNETKTSELSVFLNWINVENKKSSIYFGSQRLVENWISELIKDINYHIQKCEYSYLYANVMSHYMESNNGIEANDEDEEGDTIKQDTGSSASTTKEETMQKFSQLVFSEADNFNKESFEEFLNTKLFNLKDDGQNNILQWCRKSVLDFCKSFEKSKPKEIGFNNLKLCIDGVLREKILGDDKIQTLTELRKNDDALKEVCALIDKRIRNYTEWSWPEPVYVEFRRNIAGRYRAFMDEDIITAIILHYLGAEWSIKMKNVFKHIYESSMWKRGSDPVGDRYRKTQSIDGYRRKFHKSAFLSILPNNLEDLTVIGAGYDDEDKNDKRIGNKHSNEFSPMEVKKKLLHVIVNEIHLNFVVRPNSPLTVVQTDVEWFGPSIVHEAVLSVMKFFGVTDNWLKFFKNFLEAPLRVGSQNAPAQIRRRGAPICHTFTTLFGETLLFIMDLFVNQVSGINIFRIHDDFWFWSYNKNSVIKAWDAMRTFTKLVDLKLNEEKSASVLCDVYDKPGTINFGDQPLPQRQVKWGFVVLHSDGVFRISQDLLEPHVKEMRDCLHNCESVMNWIHCHNKYIRFFIRNFIEPARTLQRQHIQQILESLHLILNNVHSETSGDVVAALKLKFSDILGNKDIIDAWVHWPIHDGGLNLYNPFLDLLPLHEAYRINEEEEQKYGSKHKRFDSCVSSELQIWKEILEKSRIRRSRRQFEIGDSSVPKEDETVTDSEIFGDDDDYPWHDQEDDKRNRRINFMVWKERSYQKRVDYKTWRLRTREFQSVIWLRQYKTLLSNLTGKSCDSGNWCKWLYNGQLHFKLGQKEDKFVDRKLVPLNLISSIQGARVHKN